jgi:hypothetical protein
MLSFGKRIVALEGTAIIVSSAREFNKKPAQGGLKCRF